jgi:hypothetical protein
LDPGIYEPARGLVKRDYLLADFLVNTLYAPNIAVKIGNLFYGTLQSAPASLRFDGMADEKKAAALSARCMKPFIPAEQQSAIAGNDEGIATAFQQAGKETS